MPPNNVIDLPFFSIKESLPPAPRTVTPFTRSTVLPCRSYARAVDRTERVVARAADDGDRNGHPCSTGGRCRCRLNMVIDEPLEVEDEVVVAAAAEHRSAGAARRRQGFVSAAAVKRDGRTARCRQRIVAGAAEHGDRRTACRGQGVARTGQPSGIVAGAWADEGDGRAARRRYRIVAGAAEHGDRRRPPVEVKVSRCQCRRGIEIFVPPEDDSVSLPVPP